MTTIPYARPRRKTISDCAYFIYLHRDQSQGDAVSDWFQAEHQLMADLKQDAGIAPDASMRGDRPADTAQRA